MAKRKPNNRGKLVAFYITDEQAIVTQNLAAQHGFGSVALYTRAVLEQHLGSADAQVALRHVGELRNNVQRNVLRAVSDLFKNMTAEELIARDAE